MTTHTPPRCANSVMSAAPTGGARVVLLDTGNYPSYSSFLNETWTFSGTDWTNTSATLINANGPLPGRTNATMCYDGYNVMLYGGNGSSSTAGVFQDTWTWNGTAWTQQTPVVSPFGRYKAEAAYLAGSGSSEQVVMFGGENLGNMLNETWIWNGSTLAWVQTFPVTSPAARVGHVMAASATQVIMFGGRGTNQQFNHTYSYSAGNWTRLFPATVPSVRSEMCMAYDVTNSLWVMFGGQNEYNYLDETWTFDGTTWTLRVSGATAGPSGRVGAQMAYDATSGKTILFGGVSATTNYPDNSTWAFNGATFTWTQLG